FKSLALHNGVSSRLLLPASANLAVRKQILPGLFLGNDKDARDTEQLKQNNITHILSIHDSARPMLEGIKYLCIPAADSPSQNLAELLRLATKVE
uniref:Dual specificity phosphatase 22 n=1 Tax=Laticauda laticaudata TaxID=8630 RepID=A0A8C5S9J1_LATLA